MDEGRRGDLEFVTIPGALRVAADMFADGPAIVDGPVTLTFRELAAEVRRVAGSLMAAGVARGDRVAIWAPNGWRWIVAALAAQSAGAAIVPINTRFRGEEA